MKGRTFILSLILTLSIGTGAYAQPKYYYVKSGDTLYSIALKYNVTLKELLATNPNIKSPSAIYAGQKIALPYAHSTNMSGSNSGNSSASYSLSSFETEVIRLCNIQRSSMGLQPFATSKPLSSLARLKCQDMVKYNYFSHTSPTYGSPFNMMTTHGISWSSAAENIAMGQRTPAIVVNAWMNSPGHRANILNPQLTTIGVGCTYNSSGMPYWSQMFIRPM